MQLYVSYSYSSDFKQGVASIGFNHTRAPRTFDDVVKLRKLIEKEHPAGTVIVINTWHELPGA